ncbi:MAG: GAF domain-containing protein [Solirubrobacteraceae bacterium]|nr:GAF domain-containing protein [Solirubrobacteraceae bacterium]
MIASVAAAPRRADGDPGALWSRREIEGLLRVSRAVAVEPKLSDVLAVIVEEACCVTDSSSSSILLSEAGGSLRLAASKGLSRDYERFLRSHFIAKGNALSRAAVESLTPMVVDDITRDPRVAHPAAAEWKSFAMREHHRSMVSAPLIAGAQVLGALNVYRADPGPWPAGRVELVATFGQHAASAIDSAKLIVSQRRQVDALARLVGVLREQTHEYANRLQALSGLLALGETHEAQQFLANLMTIHHESYASVVACIRHPIIAGLLLAEMDVARHRGVDVRLHARSRLDALPPRLGDADAVTIVANLVENAIEAVATQPASRRKVAVRISQSHKLVTITVRDWGAGRIADLGDQAFSRGWSSKADHAGLGLALVSEAVASAHGSISVREHKQGVAVSVALPYDHGDADR